MLLLLFSFALLGYTEVLNLEGLQIQKHDNVVLLDGLSIDSVPEKVEVTDLADLISRSFWAGKLKETSPIKVDHQNIPSSNLFIVNFGADRSILSKSNPLSGQQAELTYDFFPADSVSLLTSMATARTPHQHGVVGEKWYVKGSPKEAYSDSATFSSEKSFPEIIHHSNEKTKIVTASPHSQLAKSFNQHSHPFDSLNGETFESNHGLGFTKDEARESFKTAPFWQDYSTQLETLDFDDPTVEKFLMGIEYLRRLSNSMKKSEEPILYSVATKSVSNDGAHEILLGAVSKLQKKFKETHPDGSSQIVFSKEPTVISNTETKLRMPQHRPVEFAESNSLGNVLQNPRTYQIGSWLFFFAVFILYYFVYDFMTMDYASDATLFTKWKRGQKMNTNFASGMDGMMDMGNVRF